MKTIVSAGDERVETQTLHNRYGRSIKLHLWKKLEDYTDKDDSKRLNFVIIIPYFIAINRDFIKFWGLASIAEV